MRSASERELRWHRQQAFKREKHEQRLLRDAQAMAWHDAAPPRAGAKRRRTCSQDETNFSQFAPPH
ncbi:MAG: hypothetical protein ABI563_00280 [Specibacter sp.]